MTRGLTKTKKHTVLDYRLNLRSSPPEKQQQTLPSHDFLLVLVGSAKSSSSSSTSSRCLEGDMCEWARVVNAAAAVAAGVR